MSIPLIALGIVAIGIILVLLVALLVFKMRREGKVRKPDYRAFFFIGICFLGSGAALMSTNPGFIGFTGLGFVYMAIGLANRDKWPKKKKKR